MHRVVSALYAKVWKSGFQRRGLERIRSGVTELSFIRCSHLSNVKGTNQRFRAALLEDVGPSLCRELRPICQRKDCSFVLLCHQSADSESSDAPRSLTCLHFEFPFKAESLLFTRKTPPLLKSNRPAMDRCLSHGGLCDGEGEGRVVPQPCALLCHVCAGRGLLPPRMSA